MPQNRDVIVVNQADEAFYALKRSQALRPSSEDVESIVDEVYSETVEAASALLAELTEREAKERDLGIVAGAVHYKTVEIFLASCVPEAKGSVRDSISEKIDTLLQAGYYSTLQRFLRETATDGADAALKTLNKPLVSKYWWVWPVLVASIEVLLIWFVVAACQRGFQTAAMCGLTLIYVTIDNFLLQQSRLQLSTSLAQSVQFIAIRRSVKDQMLDIAVVEEQHRTAEENLAKFEKRYFVRIFKNALIFFGATIAAITTFL